MLWAGWILCALPIGMLVVSAGMKLARPEFVLEEFGRLGYSENVLVGLGVVELVCAILYAIPRTCVLGAILVTGYLGGATATHLRIDDPFLPPVVLGVLVWGGLWLRDSRVRALVPLRQSGKDFGSDLENAKTVGH